MGDKLKYRNKVKCLSEVSQHYNSFTAPQHKHLYWSHDQHSCSFLMIGEERCVTCHSGTWHSRVQFGSVWRQRREDDSNQIHAHQINGPLCPELKHLHLLFFHTFTQVLIMHNKNNVFLVSTFTLYM